MRVDLKKLANDTVAGVDQMLQQKDYGSARSIVEMALMSAFRFGQSIPDSSKEISPSELARLIADGHNFKIIKDNE